MRPAEPCARPGRRQARARAAGRIAQLFRSGAAPLPRRRSRTRTRRRMMRDKPTRKHGTVAFALLVAASVGLAGCGDHVGKKQAAVTPTKLAITASEAGKQL